MTAFAELARSAQPALGAWIKLPALESVELMAVAGMDFIAIDLEHSPLSMETTSTLVSVATGRGLLPAVRIPDHSPTWVQRTLDAGALAIIAPHVDSLAEAQAIRAASRFAPNGTRGVGPTSRAGNWNLTPMSAYLRSDRQVAVIAQIESGQAIDSVPKMLESDAVDGVLLGAADLSVELGLEMTDPKIMDLMLGVLDLCLDSNVMCGIAIGADGRRAAELGHRGFSFVIAGNDATILGTAALEIVTSARANRT